MASNLMFCSLADASFSGYLWSSGHYFSFFCFVALGKRDRSKLFWLNQLAMIEAIFLVAKEVPANEQPAA
ncbi:MULTISPECIES: hypothetical protein [Prochlorococcus]|uniref:hypothetical protein n=1 Tax=Prochlorococcus TaxID=1218 RepID=UPI0007BC6086|nr:MULTISPECIES: hypothetical protein [Prochlorococcus]KZR66680.1 hypothetical protein PMIT1312_00805 [Prochlorococcus marinus str. MIT 1312]KZR83205.1 hypothetical protein PMIT1327_00591 [Prochlorococcus marinus str. MIT 1327]NMO83510.1 hypothetical protein [Prochlorococcus sp. P1344]NMP05862.1 hypothetical protein [Prochlorococcus sp. P1361]NMP12887.1 hypothetical protein [Prochlorococcus sp.P1363]